MVFYFTGTGNSLYAAKKIEDNPISILQIIHNTDLHFSEDTVGIVSPVYGHEVPPMVKEFLRKAIFHTDYFYMILTYGNRHGGATELAKQLCEECGIDVRYINILWMADNWLPAFDMNEQKAIDKRVDGQIAAICADLSARKAMIAPVTDADRAAHREYLSRIRQMPPDVFRHFIKIGDACVGCGICEMVCPSGSIRAVGGKAVHTPEAVRPALPVSTPVRKRRSGLPRPKRTRTPAIGTSISP